jgi:hypothetical protein
MSNDTNQSKILPVVHPPITTFPAYAAELAILFGREQSHKWVYSHYLQTYAVDIQNRYDNYNGEYKEYWPPYIGCFFGDVDNRRRTHEIGAQFFLVKGTCPHLYNFEIPNKYIASHCGSFASFIKECIDNELYLYTYVDVSKIKLYCMENPLSHEVLIFGYDDKEKNIYYADFPNNISNKYNFNKCSYGEVDRAFESVNNAFVPVVKSTAMIQFAERGRFYFSYAHICDQIHEYISPRESDQDEFNNYIMSRYSHLWNTKTYMGVNVYEYFINFLHYEIGAGRKRIDYRLFHAMYDHKEMMIKRMEYLVENGYIEKEKLLILKEYEIVKNNALSIRNLILKYNIQQKLSILHRVQALLSETKELEIKLLKVMFDV